MVIVGFKITEEEIQIRVQELAREIYNYFGEKGINEIYLFFILRGSFMFTSDLMRKLSTYDMSLLTDVISIQSYVGTKSGEVKINLEDIYRNDLNDKNVLIVDDILDTGKTITYVRQHILESYQPSNLEFCCFLKKQLNQQDINFKVRFIGFNIPNLFVVGYGLDYNGKYRELPFITSIDQVEL